MVLVNLFIAFFIIVALSVSWLVLNFVFESQPVRATADDNENVPDVPQKAPKIGRERKKPTCRDQVVAAAKAVTKEKGTNEFAAKEIVEYLIKKGTDYSTSTIRGSVNTDFERVGRGRYRLAGG